MTKDMIAEAQKYLTVNNGQHERNIIDLVSLSKNHTADELIRFLKNLYIAKKRRVTKLLEMDRSTLEIDRNIAGMFRIHLALRTIQQSLEEDDAYEQKPKQTATAGG